MSDTTERMQEVGRYITTILPPHTGFVFLAFDFDRPGARLDYISNGRRSDVVKAMREFIAKAGQEGNFCKDLSSRKYE